MTDTQTLDDMRVLAMDQMLILRELVAAVYGLAGSLVVPAPIVNVPAAVVHYTPPDIVLPPTAQRDVVQGVTPDHIAQMIETLKEGLLEINRKIGNAPATTIRGGGITQEALSAALLSALTNYGAATNGGTGLTDGELRASPLSTFGPPIQVSSSSVAAVVTDQTIVTPTATKAIRFLKLHLHMDPAAAAGSYNTVTVKVGALTLFVDKFEPGLPYMESLLIASPVVDAPLTITTTTADRIFYNVRYQETT